MRVSSCWSTDEILSLFISEDTVQGQFKSSIKNRFWVCCVFIHRSAVSIEEIQNPPPGRYFINLSA